ncbi:MAG: DUF2007 domain-containing protein [Flavobacteriaceae bacterium]
MKNFVVAAIFTYAHEFAVLRLILEQRGISHFFQNETMLSVLPFHSHALGGIRLMVHPTDIDEVHQIINDLQHNKDLHIV